jgi:hypothetical protein
VWALESYHLAQEYFATIQTKSVSIAHYQSALAKVGDKLYAAIIWQSRYCGHAQDIARPKNNLYHQSCPKAQRKLNLANTSVHDHVL